MDITSVDPERGVFGGNYQSLVGVATKWYVLTGRIDLDGNTIGWTVNWQNSHRNAHSVTTWSGQQQFNSIDEPVILTTWLLTSLIRTGSPLLWDLTPFHKPHHRRRLLTKPSCKAVEASQRKLK